MTRRIRGIAGALAFLFAGAFAQAVHGKDVAHLPAPGSYALAKIQRAPDAQLLNAQGEPVALSTFTHGAVTALGFFYGQCRDPAGCPVAWSAFEAVRSEANTDPLLKTRLRLLFVSLDPERDNPRTMRLLQEAEGNAYAAPWIFLTSRSQQDIAPLLSIMGEEIAFDTDSQGRKTGAINHMLKVFLIDPDGFVREIYTTAFLTPENLLNDARTLALAFPQASNAKPR